MKCFSDYSFLFIILLAAFVVHNLNCYSQKMLLVCLLNLAFVTGKWWYIVVFWAFASLVIHVAEYFHALICCMHYLGVEESLELYPGLNAFYCIFPFGQTIIDFPIVFYSFVSLLCSFCQSFKWFSSWKQNI